VAIPNLGQPRVDARGDAGGGAVFEELHERSPSDIDFGRRCEGSQQTGTFEEEATEHGECERRKPFRIGAAPGRPGLGKANDPRRTDAPRRVNGVVPGFEANLRKGTSEPGLFGVRL
jgi:hypothetical protein